MTPNTLNNIPIQIRENLGALDRRILELSDWIERDRREPDKILTYAHQLRNAVLKASIEHHT